MTKQKITKQKLSKADAAFMEKHSANIYNAEKRPSKNAQTILQFCNGAMDDTEISFLQGFLYSAGIKTMSAFRKAFSEIPVVNTTGRHSQAELNAEKYWSLSDCDHLQFWIANGYFAGLEVKPGRTARK